jgi:Transcriptional regulatory protein, C terminal
VRMDVERHTVSVDGAQIQLRLKEFELLEMLLRNAGRVLTRTQLIERVWGADYIGSTKTLDVHLTRLRTKIELDPGGPRHLVTVRGRGYKFEPGTGIALPQGVVPQAGQGKGVLAIEAELPITGYDELTAAQVLEHLPALSQLELAVIDCHERSHAGRGSVLARSRALRGPEPWAGYDEMGTKKICSRLRESTATKTGEVLDYERMHQGRWVVLEHAEQARGLVCRAKSVLQPLPTHAVTVAKGYL